MAMQEFSLPDELFQEVLVSKFSEEHVEKTEPDTGMMPFAPIRANQLMRIANVSKVFFSTPEAKKFLKISYNFIKDVLFSQQETEKKWEHFRNMYAKKLYNERETKKRKDKKSYGSALTSVLFKIQSFGRIIRMIRRILDIYKNIGDADFTIEDLPEPKDDIDIIHNSIEKAYKTSFILYLNVGTDFMATYFINMLEALGQGIYNSIIKHSIDRLVDKEIGKRLRRKIRNYLVKKAAKGGAQSVAMKAAGVTLKRLSGWALLGAQAFIEYSILQSDTAELAHEVNSFIDTEISNKLRNGISLLREMENMTRGFKSPKEKILNVHDYVLEHEKEIGISRIFRRKTQSDEQRKVALINVLLENTLKMLDFNTSKEAHEVKKYIENIIAEEDDAETEEGDDKDGRLRALWENSKTRIFIKPQEFVANGRYINYVFSKYHKIGEAKNIYPNFNERISLFSNDDMIDVDEKEFIIKEIYEELQDFHLIRIKNSYEKNMIKRKQISNKLKEISDILSNPPITQTDNE